MLIYEINECSLEEVLILEDGAQSAARRKKILKAFGLCLSRISREIIDETIVEENMSFQKLWTLLRDNYGTSNINAMERVNLRLDSCKLKGEEGLAEKIF